MPNKTARTTARITVADRAADGRLRGPLKMLVIIAPRLHSHQNVGPRGPAFGSLENVMFAIITTAAMNAALISETPHLFRVLGACGRSRRGGRNQMDHAVMIVAQIAQESRQHGGG